MPHAKYEFPIHETYWYFQLALSKWLSSQCQLQRILSGRIKSNNSEPSNNSVQAAAVDFFKYPIYFSRRQKWAVRLWCSLRFRCYKQRTTDKVCSLHLEEVQVLCLLVYAPELQHIAYSIQLLLCLLMERLAQKSKDVCELAWKWAHLATNCHRMLQCRLPIQQEGLIVGPPASFILLSGGQPQYNNQS